MTTEIEQHIDVLMPYQASSVNREDQSAEATDAGVEPALLGSLLGAAVPALLGAVL